MSEHNDLMDDGIHEHPTRFGRVLADSNWCGIGPMDSFILGLDSSIDILSDTVRSPLFKCGVSAAAAVSVLLLSVIIAGENHFKRVQDSFDGITSDDPPAQIHKSKTEDESVAPDRRIKSHELKKVPSNKKPKLKQRSPSRKPHRREWMIA